MFLSGVGLAQSKPTHSPTPKPETSHLRFVIEFLRELEQDEDLKKTGQKELAGDKTPNDQFSSGIYCSKSVQLELQSQIAMLKRMRLNHPFDKLIPTLIACYQSQIEIHQQMKDIGGKFLVFREGVDYPALAAKFPELRAELDDTQKIVFDSAVPVFMTLIDPRPDSQGHASHLLITKAEKADLMNRLDTMLKDEPETGDHDYYMSAAMILRGGFQKGYKYADDPWD